MIQKISAFILAFILLHLTEKPVLSAEYCPAFLSVVDNIDDTVVKMTDTISTPENIFKQLESAFQQNNISLIRLLSESLIYLINNNKITDNSFLSRAYYLIGASLSVTKRESESFFYFDKALKIAEMNGDYGLRSRILYFMGYTCDKIGDYLKSQRYFSESLELKKNLFGPTSPELLPVIISLSISQIGLRDYMNAIETVNYGLKIVSENKMFKPVPEDLALLYQNKGIALTMISEYKQGILNLQRALHIYESTKSSWNDNLLNLINNIATAYYYLGEEEKSVNYYEMGYRKISDINSMVSFYFALNYARLLGRIGEKAKGEQILKETIFRLEKFYDKKSREYTVMITSYAGYLRSNQIDILRSLKIYESAYEYIRNHPWDRNLNLQISMGYALSLMENGMTSVAYDSIRVIIFRSLDLELPDDPFINPPRELLKNDLIMWELMKAKYVILRDLFKKTGAPEMIIKSAETAELLVYILENIRLNIGEEESRLLFGERYRDSYMYVIDSYENCFALNSDKNYLQKIYEFSERSKASNLLSYTRELKGIRHHVPPELAVIEKESVIRTGFYTSRIAIENNSGNPDREKVKVYTEELLEAINKRDSIINLFEKNYPGYYKMKYDTKVASIETVLKKTGRNSNFLSYLLNDSVLYIILINRNHLKFNKIPIDSGFFKNVNLLRRLLSNPVMEGKTLDSYLDFQRAGYYLYTVLIKPVEDYLISDRLIISPDNELSFTPFEVLLYSDKSDTSLCYNSLDYLMKKYNISYSYSATLLAETERTKPSLFNQSAIFALSYSDNTGESINDNNRLYPSILPLRYSLKEAAYVSRKISGDLFVDRKATKETFLKEAGNYDIIHLAMHTLIDDAVPFNSGLIFYGSTRDTTESNFLRLYEIYGMQTNSKMTVLSSCMTGSGTMYSGEGVLSLARGFIMSGSKSVIMSLWEVDDMSGADIVNMFYKNLKSGLSKSHALKKAREAYLKKSDMRLSHPFYWAPLVIYGDNNPLYFNKFVALSPGVIILFTGIISVIYYKKRM